MSQTDNKYHLSVRGLKNAKWIGKQDIIVPAAEVYTLPISIAVDPYELKDYMTDIQFVVKQVSGDNNVEIVQDSRFFKKR